MKAHRVWKKIVYDVDPFVSLLIEELRPSVYFQHCEVMTLNVFPSAWLPEEVFKLLWENAQPYSMAPGSKNPFKDKKSNISFNVGYALARTRGKWNKSYRNRNWVITGFFPRRLFFHFRR